MSLTLLLLLLLVCYGQASHFYGTVMTYYPTNNNSTGSITVDLRYKLNFHSCAHVDTWSCHSGDCGTETSLVLNIVSTESGGEWCQREGIMTRQISSNAPFQLLLDGGNWIGGIQNSVSNWRAVTLVELRTRSDTGRANRSPQTTILPAVRVPSNCPRDFNLVAFDPDGDEVKCRYGISTLSECNPCTPPAVFSLSSSCVLSFNSSSTVGPYAVQLVMEDFPRQNITLTATTGSQEVRTTHNAISKIPVQFVVRVDSNVVDCTEGLYLPMFLPPTPDNGARLYTAPNQTLEINISAVAINSLISELLFSGPHNVEQTSQSAAGPYTLRWMPSNSEEGESHPICFVIQAVSGSAVKYHSQLRCVIVTVGDEPIVMTTMQPTAGSTDPLITDITLDTSITESMTESTDPPTTDIILDTTITESMTESTDPPTTDIILDTTTTGSTTGSTVPSTTPETTPDTTTTGSTTGSTVPSTTPETTPDTTITESMTESTDPPTTETTPDTTTTGSTMGSTVPSTAVSTQNTTAAVINQIVVGLRVRISSSVPLSEDDITNTTIQQIKDELVKRGLPANISLRLVSSVQVQPTATAPPVLEHEHLLTPGDQISDQI